MLSAFTEQALGEKQRGKVLRHLALCGRCRQVVMLAREAADAVEGGKGEAARRRHGSPRAWWRSWGFALAPAAAVAATTVIAIYIHERSLEKAAEVARLEQLRTDEKPPMQQPVLPQPQVPVATPQVAPRSAPEKLHKTEPTAARIRAPLAEPDETAAAPPPVAMNGLLPAPGAPAEAAEPADAERLERHRTNDKALAPMGASQGGPTPTQAAVFDEELKRQDEERTRQTGEVEERRRFEAKTPAPASERGPEDGGAGSGPAGSNETIDLQAQQREPEQGPTPGALQMHRLGSMAGMIGSPRIFHLPSGRPAISVASGNHRMLAVDERGALFISDDSGETWEKVDRQWAGRAVLVRRHSTEPSTVGAAPAPDTAPGNSGAVSHPDTVFELVNDQSQVWISVDGKTWTEK
jgi:hypothetical protein